MAKLAFKNNCISSRSCPPLVLLKTKNDQKEKSRLETIDYSSEAEVLIDVYKGDGNFATSGTTLLSGLDLQETCRAIDNVCRYWVEYLLYPVLIVFQ